MIIWLSCLAVFWVVWMWDGDNDISLGFRVLDYGVGRCGGSLRVC